MKTSTKKQINGWNGIYTPKNLKVNVCEWLRENGHDEEDCNVIFDETTFGDLKGCVASVDKNGTRTLDWDKLNNYLLTYYIDSYLRDVIFDALFSMDNK